MQVLLDDYEVRFKREETIAEIALDCHREGSLGNRLDFNIVTYVKEVLARKTPLHFEFFNMKPGDKYAYVSYNPLTLHIDKCVWEDADLGDPFSRFIIAHEIGHILLHDHHAKPFSIAGGNRRTPRMNEISAEWQANIFAAYFLLPDHIVRAHMDADSLARLCSVEKKLAQDRVSAVSEAMTPRPKIAGSFCINCGNFTERRKGSVECTICGKLA